jgi:hypothetical protein
MKLLREHDSLPAIIRISKIKDPITDKGADRQHALLTSPETYLVVSVNGRENDSEAGAAAADARHEEAAGTDGIMQWNNLTAANYSPDSDDDINFLIL